MAAVGMAEANPVAAATEEAMVVGMATEMSAVEMARVVAVMAAATAVALAVAAKAEELMVAVRLALVGVGSGKVGVVRVVLMEDVTATVILEAGLAKVEVAMAIVAMGLTMVAGALAAVVPVVGTVKEAASSVRVVDALAEAKAERMAAVMAAVALVETKGVGQRVLAVTVEVAVAPGAEVEG